MLRLRCSPSAVLCSHDIDKKLEPNIKYRYVDPLEKRTRFIKDNVLYNKLVRIHNELTQSHQEVTQDKICDIVGMDKRTIRRYTLSGQFLANIAKDELLLKREKNHENLEKNIRSKVEKAIIELKATYPRPSCKEIAEKSGYSLRYLRRFPSVQELLQPFTKGTNNRIYRSKEKATKKMLSKFYSALEKLESQGIAPDISKIAQLCEVSESYLRRFQEIRLFLAELASKRTQRTEEALYVRMKQTYDEMKLAVTDISIPELCERLCISITTLKRYGKTRSLLKQIIKGEI